MHTIDKINQNRSSPTISIPHFNLFFKRSFGVEKKTRTLEPCPFQHAQTGLNHRVFWPLRKASSLHGKLYIQKRKGGRRRE